MNEQLTIFYNKDKKHTNDYIVKRVFTPEGEYYSQSAYYMINNKIKEFKSNFFDKIDTQFIMGVDLNDYIIVYCFS